jgi:hypothetical protein
MEENGLKKQRYFAWMNKMSDVRWMSTRIGGLTLW